MKFKGNYKYINPSDYVKIFAHPQWYLELEPALKEFFYDYDGKRENKSQEWLDHRKEFVKMVCELLEANQITIGGSGMDWDKERLSIDTVVVHHSSTSPETPIIAIDALGLIRLYAPTYSRKGEEQFGQPIWSNHFYKGKPTFIAYHYIIKEDGLFEQILQDNQIGWHCGNWDYNRRSVAICFLDELEEKMPTEKATQAAREIIKRYPNCAVLGHREIKPSTACPGNLFLGENGWKKDLLMNY